MTLRRRRRDLQELLDGEVLTKFSERSRKITVSIVGKVCNHLRAIVANGKLAQAAEIMTGGELRTPPT